MKKKGTPSSIRLSDDGKQLHSLLAQKLGISKSAVLEIALRRLAESEGIVLPSSQEK